MAVQATPLAREGPGPAGAGARMRRSRTALSFLSMEGRTGASWSRGQDEAESDSPVLPEHGAVQNKRFQDLPSPVNARRSRDSPDLGNCSTAPHVNAIKRRFSGTPLLPPLACRHVALSEASRPPEPEGPRVVFTIEESRPSSSQEPGFLRSVGCVGEVLATLRSMRVLL
ncbi:hypothetical protein UY3_18714 [Chelonia mydas]|uniref:Uncharacterized protein n=1 Tax=Chelonia mydas TaxID=8469 RepID=M7B717_CHEMY|nr:hypothetical protein UY3_18714 [Chelonia mydas]